MKMFISSDPVCRTVEGITRSVIGTAVWRTAGTGRTRLEGIYCQGIYMKEEKKCLV